MFELFKTESFNVISQKLTNVSSLNIYKLITQFCESLYLCYNLLLPTFLSTWNANQMHLKVNLGYNTQKIGQQYWPKTGF